MTYSEGFFDGEVAALWKIRREDRPKSRAWPRELDEELGLFGREKGGVGDLTTRIIGKL